ncbi:MAG: hypothetical protein U5M23_09690 [Marinagarivorans sp.]|nr:hypothetical protein [Marinagarivorans sp.]
MNGIDLIKQLRSDATTKHGPIVVISANLDAERLANRMMQLMFAGVEWLQKPQTGSSILCAVKTVISHQRANELTNLIFTRCFIFSLIFA